MTLPNDGAAPSDTAIVASLPAPDGEHKAVVLFRIGGGGWSPYCEEHVGVVAIGQTDASAWAPPNKVFSSDCHGAGTTYEEMKKAVTWKSAGELRIAFGFSRVIDVRLRGLADDGRIRVTYVTGRTNNNE